MANLTDVVIVGWRPDAVKKCLDSIEAHSNGEARVILVCNRKDVAHELDKRPGLEESIAVVPFNNVGWVAGANMGIAVSESPYVVLMNDDVEVLTDGWLEKLAWPFSRIALADRLACVAPWGGRGWQGRQPQNTGAALHEPELYLNGFGIGRFPISFFCVMFSRKALDAIGCLDERFSPAYAEDDDWLARAHLSGWKMAIQTDVQVKHTGGDYDGQRSDLQERNVRLLREKYQNILDRPKEACIIEP